MRKKMSLLLAALMVLVFCLSGCGKEAEPAAPAPAEEAETPEETPEEPEAPGEEASDQEKADEVAALIDAVYVQKRTDETDAQCAAAKAAWDALTDAQKELVEGEEADPDYFGRDTGDASKDDPLTSFNDSRVADIKGIEDALAAANPDWSVRRAFTAQIIINHVQARDNEFIDNMDQALERAVANGVKNLVIQPTHLMRGAEYDELMESVGAYEDKFESVKIAEPLLGWGKGGRCGICIPGTRNLPHGKGFLQPDADTDERAWL